MNGVRHLQLHLSLPLRSYALADAVYLHALFGRIVVRWREEAMSLKHGSVALTSFVALAAAVGSVSAVSPTPPEYGLRGLRRVEIVFTNVDRGGIVGSVGVVRPEPPMEDLGTHDLAKDQECRLIGPTLAREGLEVVDRCRRDDLACAKLDLTVEDNSIDRSSERMYLIGIELSQRVQLARDPTIDLSVPTTWSMHRVAVVAADHSATRTSCIRLREMATVFATDWKLGNR
ncbi:MAG TPA: hypothetical protein VFW15_10420 [Thermoanaerobaculia bacterium]|nr:hypothetical protein [Thermoanaerobaculia bacterium]